MTILLTQKEFDILKNYKLRCNFRKALFYN